MRIIKIKINNFRILQDTTLEPRDVISLLVGKNNTGKTSLITLFEKFFVSSEFGFNDFSLKWRQSLINIDLHTDINKFSIKMILEIKYDEQDDLSKLSELMLDLDPNNHVVKILLQCSVNQNKLSQDMNKLDPKIYTQFIEKNLKNYLSQDVYIFANELDLETQNQEKLIKKKIEDVKQVINLQILHAKRDVVSSESNSRKHVLSSLTTRFFNSKVTEEFHGIRNINELIFDMDKSLDEGYNNFFNSFLQNAKDLLNIDNLRVVSNIGSSTLIGQSSRVVYGAEDHLLHENLNGLGYLNILYLLLSLEVTKENFMEKKCPINLLFIEEPEARTHPQMQYVFSQNLKKILGDVKNLQTIVTTHSSHIVSQWDFADIRYLLKKTDESKCENIEIKNLDTELKQKYQSKENEFKFLKQYLTIQSTELFFADKVIFIEGTTEKILLPYFLNSLIKSNEILPNKINNISFLEVGTNAKIFEMFLDFIGVKTLIITDIDTIKQDGKTKCEVKNADSTSNYSLKHFLEAPDESHPEYIGWFSRLKEGKLNPKSVHIYMAYQKNDSNYHARSFEDAFINSNLSMITRHKEKLQGLKNKSDLDKDNLGEDIYKLTEKILDKKSDFASSILFLALTEEVEWQQPAYIKEGLLWLIK